MGYFRKFCAECLAWYLLSVFLWPLVLLLILSSVLLFQSSGTPPRLCIPAEQKRLLASPPAHHIGEVWPTAQELACVGSIPVPDEQMMETEARTWTGSWFWDLGAILLFPQISGFFQTTCRPASGFCLSPRWGTWFFKHEWERELWGHHR